MRRETKTVFLLLAVLFFCACTTYERKVTPFRMPDTYPNATEAAGARIASKAYDNAEEAAAAFGFDILKAGILPVQVVFDNKGAHPLEIVTDKTFLIDAEDNLWPILDQSLAYDRLNKATELGKVMPEAGKGALLAGAAGAVIGAAIGIVTGENVAAAAGKGAAVGAAAGATIGGVKGLSDPDVKGQIRDDLQSRSLTTRAISPNQIAHGFIFYPGEARQAKELRISIRAIDTKQVYPLTLKF